MEKFICIQKGARRNYAIPILLEQEGMLEAFYTDACANSGIGQYLATVCPSSLRRGAIGRLLNRKLPKLLDSKIQTDDLTTLRHIGRQALAGSNEYKRFSADLKFDEEFGKFFIPKGVGQATHVFSMFGEGIDFLEFAKNRRLTIFNEIYISPMVDRIVAEESEKFPELASDLLPDIPQLEPARFQRICKVTDRFIVPSQFVLEGLMEFGVRPEQCDLVPYAVDDSWFEVENNPVNGRVLFVGSAVLRKGIHVLGMASQQLGNALYEFRIAGNVSQTMQHHRLTQQLNFLDRVPRSKIQSEFSTADVFVLPSLAEGSAEVIYEALAVGIPVITTHSAGSIVRDGIEGFVVPERDAVALAARIEQVVMNRELRDQMAIAAKARAREYTWNNYQSRLKNILRGNISALN
jgi:glycosyltransferase involved in cell wall biosynthesis